MLGCGVVASAFAQERHWIELRDRSIVESNDQPRSATRAGISERALRRRAKVLSSGQLVQANDFPVSESTLDIIRSTGARIRSVSRWLNAVSVEASPAQIAFLRQLPIVAQTIPVARYTRKPVEALDPPAVPLLRSSAANRFEYGTSLTQIVNINAVELHNLGVVGEGVLVGMLDDGYTNHFTHEALAPIDVVAEYDFIQRDTNTSYSSGEAASQGSHGAGCLAVLGGYKPGKLIGAAPRARFLLGKTEIIGSETHIEEDLYVEGLEWLERNGADVVSTSLGYRDFDAVTYSYPFDSLNGRNTIVARAAAVAARKGILLVTAMGNEGAMVLDTVISQIVHLEKTLISPADADSILGVGATSSDGELAAFSGTGPTADGRIKPDIVAQGLGVYWAGTSTATSYGFANGTSLATPLTAGAAALVLSAHPQLTPMQVREAILQTGRPVDNGTWQTASYPNNYYGHGRLDALRAAMYHGPVVSNRPEVERTAGGYDIRVMIRSTSSVPADSVRFVYNVSGGAAFSTITLQTGGQPYEYIGSVVVPTDSRVTGYITFADNNGRSQRLPFNAPDSLLDLDSLSGGDGPSIPTSVVLYQNYPNPFNAGTVILADVPVAGHATVDVYDLLGRHVRTLFNGTSAPGRLTLRWDGRTSDGTPVASGVYVYRLITPASSLSRTMVFVR